MKIAVAGTINRDILNFSNGRMVESLGGLLYSILTLAALAPEDAIITPVVNVGDDIYNELMEKLSKHGCIELSGIKRLPGFNNAVYLNLSPDRERDEHTDLNLPPIEFAQLKPHLDCDALMLNFTSGFDMEVDVVERAIEDCGGLKYIDIHSLSLGIDEDKHRCRRKVTEPHRWVEGADFVQLTADEAWSFYTGDWSKPETAIEVGRMIPGWVKKACLMTMGAEGVHVFTSEGDFRVEVEPVPRVVDTTGCGDVFGASFLLKFLETGDLIESAKYGVNNAAQKCAFSGIESMGRLND